jgi:hypothetical protein
MRASSVHKLIRVISVNNSAQGEVPMIRHIGFLVLTITVATASYASVVPISVTYNVNSVINDTTLTASGAGTGDSSTGNVSVHVSHSALPSEWDLASAFYASVQSSLNLLKR